MPSCPLCRSKAYYEAGLQSQTATYFSCMGNPKVKRHDLILLKCPTKSQVHLKRGLALYTMTLYKRASSLNNKDKVILDEDNPPLNQDNW